MLSSITACSSKTSLITKSEEKTMKATIGVEKPIINTYKALDDLPQKYNAELAEKNGDVVNINGKNSNIEKLDKFIEFYQNKKTNEINMVRITRYTTEGDAMIADLIIDNQGIKLIEDITRDKFSNEESRKKTEYKIVDISKKKEAEGLSYVTKTDKGEERILFFTNNN